MARQHTTSGSHTQGTSEPGQQGGGSGGGSHNPGNFANDREKASQAGKVGGQQSHGSSGAGGSSGGQGGFAKDHDKASEAGRKGGQH